MAPLIFLSSCSTGRVCIFSIFLRGRDTPLTPILFGILTCAVNGYVQGRYLTHYIYYNPSWFYDSRFLIGVSLFLLGMAINIHSDSILRSLRAPGETAYKIPYGKIFTQICHIGFIINILQGVCLSTCLVPTILGNVWSGQGMPLPVGH